MSELEDLRDRLREFAGARDWEQFHSPKNLAMALIVEAGELVEHFQWLTAAESSDLPEAKREEIANEMADVLLYLVRIADRLNVDLHAAALRKIAINETRYPVAKARGTAKKSADL
jgi:NTP pyrophosphatase (non-canonical NTP hydrolase)